MGAIAAIIADISDDVVAALAAAGYPALAVDASGNAGAILVGPAKAFEQAAPPRIVFEPTGSKFSTADYASSSATLTTLERRNQKALRTIAAEDMAFNVRCWGSSDSGGVDHYDVTRALYHQVIASLQTRFPGGFIADAGKWTSGTNVAIAGQEFVFGLTILTPVLDALAPYAVANKSAAARSVDVEALYAPSDVTAVGTEKMDLGDGSTPEEGCT